MFIELSKSQKKIARELIAKSLQKECEQFLEKIEMSVSNRDREGKSPHETYLNLYEEVKSFDKHIERRYDDLTGSKYFIVIVGLLIDEVLTQEDFNHFDEDMREKLLNAAKLWSK